jgi:two-component system sensor histidine kinase CpxA
VIRSTYVRIFLWFWLAIVGVGVAVFLITITSGSGPRGRRWLGRSVELYGRNAVDFYTHGGLPLLARYLDDIDEVAGVQAALVDPLGHDVTGRGIPFEAQDVLRQARARGETSVRPGLAWVGATVVPSDHGVYLFVARVYPLETFWRLGGLRVFLFRVTVALVSAGLLCLLLMRHIAAPIRALQIAAGRIAEGDLSVRATPAIGTRNDELADLAHDFDRMAERIEGLLQKQRELLGDISHELRSPLARLGVSLELARRGETQALDRMQVDLDRLETLIGQILVLTRLESLEGPRTDAPLNLGAILESVAADAEFEAGAEEKSVVLSRVEDCWLGGDAALLRSCFENVVRNAVRYTRPGTAVEINLELENNHSSRRATVLIEDHGPGVPADALPRLFEPFYRVSQSRDRSTGGSGLGLSIAQKIVALHGGTIVARNREPDGLSIKIELTARELPRNPNR